MAKKKSKQNYDSRDEARAFLPEVVAALKKAVLEGKGIAVIQASQTLMKLAEVEKMGGELAPPDINFLPIGADENGNLVILGPDQQAADQPVCDEGTVGGDPV